MKVKIGTISQIQFGLYAKPSEYGNVAYLQAKHFDDWGKQTYAVDTFVQKNHKNKVHLLQDGDILLAGKGMRNFAWTYHHDFGPAMASSLFFVLKTNRARVLPDFLTTLFNMPQTQAHFQVLGAGSSIPSIRKSELEAFKVKLPPLALQEKAIKIKRLHDKDIALSQQLIAEKQRSYQAVMKKLINQENEK